jgi:hypothetical protein
MPNKARVRGYTQMRRDGKRTYLHRLIVKLAGEDKYGTPFDQALCVMHECDNPACFRYDHLRLGSHTEHMADMGAKRRNGGKSLRQELCKNGHDLDANAMDNGNGNRTCRICKNERRRQRRLGASL